MAIFRRYLDDGQKYRPNIATQILPKKNSKTGLRACPQAKFFVPHFVIPHNMSTGRIFGLWFSYLHTTCNGSSAPPPQPRPIHATPSAATKSCLCLRLRLRCRCRRRCRRRRRNLHHHRRRRRHRHRLTTAAAFAATFSSLYLVDCRLCPLPVLLPPLSSSSPPPLSQSPLLSPPPPPPSSSSLPL
jgi:hypothetical protein